MAAPENNAIPRFTPGDTVRVHVKVVEGDSERIQAFEGVVLRRRGKGVSESFSLPLLDHPHYTRPRTWRGREVPEVLMGGDHAKVAAWRAKAARAATKRKRPDLLQ